MHAELSQLLPYLGELEKWYLAVKRDLPWRADPHPYKIWISEIMSQQSTIKMMLPFFNSWMQRFPTLDSLVAASEKDVLAAWAGLGYYSRARNIKKAAEQIQNDIASHGDWPRRAEDWLKFSGVGPYTSRAITSISFGERVLPLDGNVIRVLSRVWNIPDTLNSPAQLTELSQLSQDLIRLAPKQVQASHLSQGFMELGATVCRPAEQARCLVCPLNEVCQAYKLGTVATTPRTKKRPDFEEKLQLALYYRGPQGEPLLREIPPGQRLAGHHEFPLWTLDASPESIEIINKIKERFELRGPVQHCITKYKFKTYLVMADDWGRQSLPAGHHFWKPRQSSPLLPTTLTRKLAKLLNF